MLLRMTTTATVPTPAAVRLAVRRAGYRSHADVRREGVRVKGGYSGTIVVVDFDSPNESRRTADTLAERLDADGYVVERVSAAVLRITAFDGGAR
jgi:hypothetical protein